MVFVGRTPDRDTTVGIYNAKLLILIELIVCFGSADKGYVFLIDQILESVSWSP